MLTQKFKTADGDITLSIPQNLSELTMGMLADSEPKPGDSLSPLDMLSVLSGVPKESDTEPCLLDIFDIDELNVFTDTVTALYYQISALKDDADKFPDSVVLPMNKYSYPKAGKKRLKWSLSWPPLNISGLKISIPKDIKVSPAGAAMEAEEVIKEEIQIYENAKKAFGDHLVFNPSANSLLHILALYFYCPATGEKFNPQRVIEFANDVIRKMPVKQALPIAWFFFSRYLNS